MQILRVTPATCDLLSTFLLAQYPLLTTGKLHKYLRENKIKVNGKKVPLTTRLLMGDEVKVFIPDDALFTASGPQYRSAQNRLTVVYEDADILLVDKPAGLLVQDETGFVADTLINRALRYLYESGAYTDNAPFTPCLCHRLDTGTSGLVILAKNEDAFHIMTELLKKRTLKKRYVCVTFGRPSPKNGVLQGYLQKDAEKGFVRVIQDAAADAKPVTTAYETLAESGRLALLSVELITGRTHQIRAHFTSIGCPLLGDSKYGNNAANREYKMKYQALCAYSIQFPAIAEGACHTLSGKSFAVQKPWYYQQILDGTLH